MSIPGGAANLGVLLAGVARSKGSGADVLEASISLANCARDAGYSHLVVGQHFLGAPNQYLHPIPLLTRLAAETGDMRLCTGIYLLSLAQPVDAAEQLATLDVISGGRLTLGIGAGYREEEFQAFGMTTKQRFSRMAEALEVVRQVWSGEPIDHEGKYFTVKALGGSMRPAQLPEPPIWSAAMLPAAVDRAVTINAKPYVGPRVPIDEFEAWVKQYREAVGDPTATVPLRRDVFIGKNRATAWDEAVANIEERYSSYNDWGLKKDLLDPTLSDAEGDLRSCVIAGDKSEVGDLLAHYVALGAGPIVMRCQWQSLDHPALLEMLENIADAVR
jgi:alkanesulfonate monooxygenase SsuD/methylene tetrahydromethanopterin reductase-like flavin-dependent oxidoreductase (luciferase family)